MSRRKNINSPTKKLIPFRLWESDIEKLKSKLVLDGTNFQRACELLVTLYINGDEYIEKQVKTVCKKKNNNRRRYTGEFDELERSMLYKKIEQVSNLSDTQRILEEIDKENK